MQRINAIGAFLCKRALKRLVTVVAWNSGQAVAHGGTVILRHCAPELAFNHRPLIFRIPKAVVLLNGDRRGPRFFTGCHSALCRDVLAGLGDWSPRESPMTTIYLVGGLLCIALGGYLLYALIKPERF